MKIEDIRNIIEDFMSYINDGNFDEDYLKVKIDCYIDHFGERNDTFKLTDEVIKYED